MILIKKTKLVAFAYAVMLSTNLFSQNVGINSDGSSPDNSAMLTPGRSQAGSVKPTNRGRGF